MVSWSASSQREIERRSNICTAYFQWLAVLVVLWTLIYWFGPILLALGLVVMVLAAFIKH